MSTDKATTSTTILSEPYPIQVLCNFISPYKGDRETLSAFLTNCQNALGLASKSQEQLLLKFIIAKLEGKAQLACSKRVIDTFDELKAILQQNFGQRKHYNHLLLDLQSCRQTPNETVAQFALRIETSLTDLQAEVYNSESLKKELPGRIAMTEDLALYTFCIGLNPRLSNIVRCREPKTLNDAIIVAVEEEKIQNLLYKTSPRSAEIPKQKFCRRCNKPGHLESECRNSESRVLMPYKPNSFPQRDRSDRAQGPSHPIICRYCKHEGHDISQCRKRQYNNSRRNVQNPSYQQQHHVTVESPPPSTSGEETDDDNINLN